MRREPGQHVVRILPDGLGHDQRRRGRNLAEDLHAFSLAGDKPVARAGPLMMGSDEIVAGIGDGTRQRLLHFLLGRPADPVRRNPQIAAGDQVDVFGRGGR